MLTLVFAPDGVPPHDRIGREVHLWRDDLGHTVARGFSAGGRRWITWLDVGTFGFSAGSRVVDAWPAAGAQPDVVVRKFQTILQPMILQALGWQTLHASAVSGPDGAFALCGAAASGKSTISFAMRRAGWTQIADDAVVMSVDDAHVTVHPLPFTSRLRETSFQHFAGPANVLADTQPPPDASPKPLRAIVVLRQTADALRPSVLPVPLAQAFSEILTHAHCFDATDRGEIQRLTQDYLTIAARVPVLALTYGAGLSGLTHVVAAIEEAAAGLGVERPAAALSL